MGKVIGIDSVIFIYLLEENKQYIKKVERFFRLLQNGEIQGIFSIIGLIEILTGPKKRNDHELASQYRDIIAHFPHLSIVGINERIVELASDLRAQYSLSTPDAIHIATAIDFGADMFLTNDKGLKKIKEIKVELL